MKIGKIKECREYIIIVIALLLIISSLFLPWFHSKSKTDGSNDVKEYHSSSESYLYLYKSSSSAIIKDGDMTYGDGSIRYYDWNREIEMVFLNTLILSMVSMGFVLMSLIFLFYFYDQKVSKKMMMSILIITIVIIITTPLYLASALPDVRNDEINHIFGKNEYTIDSRGYHNLNLTSGESIRSWRAGSGWFSSVASSGFVSLALISVYQRKDHPEI